jgi:ABC-type sugar transport system ATPase subunit
MLIARNISKRFGAVTVLQNVDFELAKGEVHALFGANGAGKSTLSKLFAGHAQPTSGDIFLQNEKCVFRSPRDALNSGVAMVMQETSLAPDLTVLENIYLPLYGRSSRIKRSQLHDQAYAVLEELGVASDIELNKTVGELSAAHRQLIEIARALALNAQVIIFDEPTTSLSPSEVTKLFIVMGKLRAKACAMIFVSHRIEELLTITDRVTILRDGTAAASGLKTSDLKQTDLVRLMIGGDLKVAQKLAKKAKATTPVTLQVSNLKAQPLLHDVSFKLHRGQILGLGGLVGSGRSETLETIFGLRPIQSGVMQLDGQLYKPSKALDAIRAGLGFVAEDRRTQSIFPDLSVRENLMLAVLSAQHSSMVRYTQYREQASDLSTKLDLPPHRLDDESMLNFSGGMQQKVLLMRWLMLNPKVLLLDEPTKGIDIGARTTIYNLLRKIADSGVSILVVSSDFEELIDLCDDIVPISDGRSIGTVPADLLDAEKLLMLSAPRSSTAGLRMFIDQVARKYDVTSFWAILESEDMVCLAASEGAEKILGFSTGSVCSADQSYIPQAIRHGQRGLIGEVSSLSSLLISTTNARGHDLGLLGFVSAKAFSDDIIASIRFDLDQYSQQSTSDQITLTL